LQKNNNAAGYTDRFHDILRFTERQKY